ncbi:MAG: aminotransferase class V-fold PLP-dependent enzyme, partial [Woeseiaceae bacterium]|nr:aminotransferase class V-fold PLP-dependent enzyme [Woeseiaceae bacterium]
CDYTASGRCLRFVESYLQSLQRVYANTHTEDDITGRSMSQLLHDAETSIKQSVNAGPDGCIIACGTGATGAIDKLQQIVGVALPPATRARIFEAIDHDESGIDGAAFRQLLEQTRPVVFVGPYEHHSNELTWRQSHATTIEVRLDASGGVDLAHLEELLADPRYTDRLRIGSFSAASNVTGVLTDVHAISSLLHRYGAIACFDYAACAPYVDIDMNPEPPTAEDDPSIDAIFISPHKFLGGPGSSGVLVFNQRIYDRSLPPTVSAGGTVDYVSMTEQDFIRDIEEREKAGTPGVLQTLKAALAFQLKDRVGVELIRSREHELTARALESWGTNDAIEILGTPDPARRIGIVSFNIRCADGKYLHHKLVTALLNDLFGIQSRAGCSCAGPYGHRLLGIDADISEQYRHAVQGGYCGIKPGWCRVGFHWVMDDLETNYIIEAVHFIANHGHRFLALYEFDLSTGTWTHRDATDNLPQFSLDAALANQADEPASLSDELRKQLYDHYLTEARRVVEGLAPGTFDNLALPSAKLENLRFFSLPEGTRFRKGN